jgi:hypothetical protein
MSLPKEPGLKALKGLDFLQPDWKSGAFTQKQKSK